MSAPPLPALATARLIVCVGPGGVGKTTTAAALGLAAAQAGRAALVLTIDPARRLADALGLDGLDDTVRPVRVPDLPPGGRLDAAMLDTRASYDALITRITHSEEERARILGNRAYRAFSRTLARSHAYIAMERLHHVVHSGGYDLVVLDTPPTRSALDILDAPGRLVRFLDERVVRWFLEAPTGAVAGLASPLMRALEGLAGASTLRELAAFFASLAHLRDGFRERAASTERLLSAEGSAFVLVAAPQGLSLADAACLREDLARRGVALDAVIFNQAFVPNPSDPAAPVRPPGEGSHPSPAVRAVREAFVRDNARRAERMRVFLAACPPPRVALATAEAEGDVRDLEGLSRLLREAYRLEA